MTPSPAHQPVNCVQFVDLITDWMDDALPPQRRQEVEEHLAICPACVAYVGQTRHTMRALRRLDEQPAAPAPFPVRERLLAAFRSWRAERGTA